jgi:hypothetical protein
MQGGRVAAGLLIVLVVISYFDNVAGNAQGRLPLTPSALRSVATRQPLATPTFLVTITLADLPVNAVIEAAHAEGLPEALLLARAVVQRLRIIGAQSLLLQTLTQPPYNAEIVDQTFFSQNSVTIRIKADQLPAIQALPGVLSVSIGPDARPTLAETPPRSGEYPGTRLPPLVPPGYN